MNEKKIFLLGVGCQKGGTSWLHKYLHSHPNCDFGFRKEYHVFDAMYLKGEKRFRKKTKKSLAILKGGVTETEVKQEKTRNVSKLKKMARFYRDINTYYDYFYKLAHKSKETRIVGDITPSYAGLPQSVLRQIKLNLEERGFDVKVVFLMRDPIDRIFSSARMSLRDRKNAGRPVTQTENEAFLTQFKNRKSERRTRYEKTITNIDAVFDPKDVFYSFYEDLFTISEVQRLVDNLGIPLISPNFEERVNSSFQGEELDIELASQARQYYNETYDFVFKRFPNKDLSALWKFN